MSETTNNLPRVMLSLSRAGAYVFRQNTGMAWAGSGPLFKAARRMLVQLKEGDVVLRAPVRPIRAGLTKGSSDVIGWKPIEITPDMVGSKVAVFVAVEVKGKTGRATPEQKNFLKTVHEAGGIAGVARDEGDVESILQLFGAK